MHPMKAWMMAATPDEQQLLAHQAKTSRQYLYHLSNGHRMASADLGSSIERVTAAMAKKSKGRLPVVYRTDLVPACANCEFARKCLGPIAERASFEVVTSTEEV